MDSPTKNESVRESPLLNVLFVCSRNQWRSPTAEYLYQNDGHVKVRSAGVAKSARRLVTIRDIEWADVVMVMETRHLQQLRKRFGAAIGRDQCHILDIPDEYGFMDSELIELLRQSVEPILNKITCT
jgi:predicted protein tyrosine phosphatase